MNNEQRLTGRGPARSVAKERFWRRHVARHARSNLTVRDYCVEAGISEPSFYAWRSELARRDCVAGRPARHQPAALRSDSGGATSPPRFLPVTIAPPVASQVEVVLPSGLLVRVPAHDAAALRTVLELLEPRSC